MSNKFKRTIGWEKFGGEEFLRLELSKPTLAKIFPGTLGEDPNNAYRTLTDMVMTRQQVYGVLSDPIQAVNSGCTESDLKLLSAALENYPKKGRNQPQLSAAGGETVPSMGL